MKALIGMLFAFGVMGCVVTAGELDERPERSEELTVRSQPAADVATSSAGSSGEAEPASVCIQDECVSMCTMNGCAGGYCINEYCSCLKCDW